MLGLLIVSACIKNNELYKQNKIHLVFDNNSDTYYPENFRVIKNIKTKNISSAGLNKIRILGSGQFDQNQLQHIINITGQKLIIVDLRQETHFFINGKPVSLRGHHDQANKHLTSAEINKNQQNIISKLKNYTSINIYHVTKCHLCLIKNNYFADKVKIDTIESEQELAQQNKVGYLHLYITDHQKPNVIETAKFIDFVNHIPKNTYLYFHCHKGVGRTTTFMVMYDMILNAKKVSFKDILLRQTMLGGKNFYILPPKHSYKYKAAVKRYMFLKDFYTFTKTHSVLGSASKPYYTQQNLGV